MAKKIRGWMAMSMRLIIVFAIKYGKTRRPESFSLQNTILSFPNNERDVVQERIPTVSVTSAELPRTSFGPLPVQWIAPQVTAASTKSIISMNLDSQLLVHFVPSLVNKVISCVNVHGVSRSFVFLLKQLMMPDG